MAQWQPGFEPKPFGLGSGAGSRRQQRKPTKFEI